MAHRLDEMKEKGSYKDISDAKKDLLGIFLAEIHSKGTNDLDTKECSEVVDMIKDLAEAEKCCMEAYYYESIVSAMEEASEDDAESMGYNNRRYASGRYAPKGRGRVMGFDARPYPHVYDPDLEPMMYGGSWPRFGYDDIRRLDDFKMDSKRMDPDDMENGRAYGDYKRAKRHYTETKSPTDKQEMNEKGMDHLHKAIWTLKEIWTDADPAMRKQMAESVNALAKDMTV